MHIYLALTNTEGLVLDKILQQIKIQMINHKQFYDIAELTSVSN